MHPQLVSWVRICSFAVVTFLFGLGINRYERIYVKYNINGPYNCMYENFGGSMCSNFLIIFTSLFWWGYWSWLFQNLEKYWVYDCSCFASFRWMFKWLEVVIDFCMCIPKLLVKFEELLKLFLEGLFHIRYWNSMTC